MACVVRPGRRPRPVVVRGGAVRDIVQERAQLVDQVDAAGRCNVLRIIEDARSEVAVVQRVEGGRMPAKRHHRDPLLRCRNTDAWLDRDRLEGPRAVQQAAHERSRAVAKDLVLQGADDAPAPLHGPAPNQRAVRVLVGPGRPVVSFVVIDELVQRDVAPGPDARFVSHLHASQGRGQLAVDPRVIERGRAADGVDVPGAPVPAAVDVLCADVLAARIDRAARRIERCTQRVVVRPHALRQRVARRVIEHAAKQRRQLVVLRILKDAEGRGVFAQQPLARVDAHLDLRRQLKPGQDLSPVVDVGRAGDVRDVCERVRAPLDDQQVPEAAAVLLALFEKRRHQLVYSATLRTLASKSNLQSVRSKPDDRRSGSLRGAPVIS